MDMPSSFQPPTSAQADRSVRQLSDVELAQVLAERLAIKPLDWHRLNRDRKVRAKEQLAAALVFLLKDQPEEALVRVEQTVGWLNHTLKAPPCPTHQERRSDTAIQTPADPSQPL
jgi:hypothetical protein